MPAGEEQELELLTSEGSTLGHPTEAEILSVVPAGPEGGEATSTGGALKQVARARNIGKSDLKLNDALPTIDVDTETYVVRADGEVLACDPATELPLTQRYFLF